MMTTSEYQSSSTVYDAAFNKVEGLAWIPWVGECFSKRSANQRLLVVGESHYYIGDTPEQLQVNRQECQDPNYTRTIFSHLVEYDDWTTRTLEKIPELLFNVTTAGIDRRRLWADATFYNFVQRAMDYTRVERPTREDFVEGWPVFKELVRIIQPSHCLFIGVKAADHVPYCIGPTEKVGRVLAKAALLEVGGTLTPMIFVQHLGRCKNVGLWHEYLQRRHPDLMGWLGAEDYAVKKTT